jgi:hypothetical protein
MRYGSATRHGESRAVVIQWAKEERDGKWRREVVQQ